MKPPMCIIRQPAGLGDILFCLKIARNIIDRGKARRVIWPVSKVYSYISKYIKVEGVEFISEDIEFEGKDLYTSNTLGIRYHDDRDILFVNLQRADELGINTDLMNIKYEAVGLDCEGWSDCITLTRDGDRERALRIHMGVSDVFTLVNSTFATYPNTLNIDIPEKPNQVEIVDVGFDVIFDWCGLIDECDEFHTVDTAFSYIANILNKDKVTLYPREVNGLNNLDYAQKIHPHTWHYN